MKRTIIYTIFLLISLPGFSQAVEMMLPSNLKQQTIITEPPTLHKGFFRAGIFTYFQFGDKYFNEDKEKIYLPESIWNRAWSYTFRASYGISERLTAELSIPYNNKVLTFSDIYYLVGSGTITNNSRDIEGHGLGDIYAAASYQVLTEKENRPSITGTFYLYFPTGEKNPTDIQSSIDYKLPTGSGAYSLDFDLRLRKIKYPISYSGYIYYGYNMEGTKLISASDTQESRFKEGNVISIGGNINLHLNDWIAVANNLSYTHIGKGEQENIPPEDLLERWYVSYDAQLVFQIRRIRLAERVSFPIKGLNIQADPQYAIYLQYTF